MAVAAGLLQLVQLDFTGRLINRFNGLCGRAVATHDVARVRENPSKRFNGLRGRTVATQENW